MLALTLASTLLMQVTAVMLAMVAMLPVAQLPVVTVVNSGVGGAGGTINTAEATAIGTISNTVNDTNIRVAGCGCEEVSGDTDVDIRVRNAANVRNIMKVDANTGGNKTLVATLASAVMVVTPNLA
jgi:hypothetical protein